MISIRRSVFSEIADTVSHETANWAALHNTNPPRGMLHRLQPFACPILSKVGYTENWHHLQPIVGTKTLDRIWGGRDPCSQFTREAISRAISCSLSNELRFRI
jgi:hypothetical protein